MRLLDDFFYIIKNDVRDGRTSKDSEVVCAVKMKSGHSIYQAHFPNNPITPGVCLVQMSTEILEKTLKRHLRLKAAVRIKFRKPIVPSVEPVFTFQKLTVSDHQVSVSVVIQDKDTQYAKMSLIYAT